MVSTYLGYDLINRNMQKSLSRITSETQVSRETQYFKDNISKVKTVDDFVDNYRLYSYAMKAYGLEDMTYATAFMKKVLNSDLTDSASFANQLSDSKYRDFASAFKFGTSTATAETTSQQDSVIAGYKQSIADEETSADTETAYYKQNIGSVTSVDGLIANSRLYDYALKAVGIDPDTYTTSFIKKVLTSDTSDSKSYLNSLDSSTIKYQAEDLKALFNFNTSGTLDSGTSAQTADQISSATGNYIRTVPSHMTTSAALLNSTYISEQMAKVTSVTDITGNTNLFGLVKTALGLDSNMLASTFQNIVESDTTSNSATGNYAYQQGGSSWVAIAKMFNFDSAGAVTTGKSAMNSDNLSKLQNQYLSNYNDSQDATDEALYTYYSAHVSSVSTVADLLANSKLYKTALTAAGLDPDTESKSKITKVLESDVSDPKSYANILGDSRYVTLAKSFNFDSKGNISAPLMAQSESEILHMSKNYVFQETRFLSGTALTTAKKAATDESTYFSDTVQSLTSVNDLLSNSRLVKYMLTSFGLDPAKVSSDTLKQVFMSDLTDSNSFANKQSDPRYAELAASFNFDTNGKVKNMDGTSLMSRRALLEAQDSYNHQTLEEEEGNDSTGVRLALYFQRLAPTISSAYDILADSALLQFFKTTYQLPDGFSSLDITVQADKVNKYMTLTDLKDPTKLNTIINRFTAMYDLENSVSDTSSASLLSGSSGGISANTLLSIAQLKLG
jgi:hypothetical protein